MPTQQKTLHIIDCGLADYLDILQQQYELKESRRLDEIPDTVLIVEHNPVITLGARQSANKLLLSEDELKGKGIDVVNVRRGGGVTAHNHGQIVFYPIINTNKLNLGITEYVRMLEQIGIEFLSEFDIDSRQKKEFPGLWINDKKIASIGVRVSKGISYHGMAININNDLSIFSYMVPCGIDGVVVTNTKEQLGKELPMLEVKKTISRIIEKHFG